MKAHSFLKLWVLLFALTSTGSVNATGLPTFDIASFIQSQIQNALEKAFAGIEQKMMGASMNIDAIRTSDEIDAVNNTSVNEIIRLNKAQEDIQNLDIIKELGVDHYACKEGIDLSKRLQDLVCEHANFIGDKIKERMDKKVQMAVKKPIKLDEKNNKALEDLVDGCTKNGTTAVKLSESKCFRADILFGEGEIQKGSIEDKGSEKFIELLTGGSKIDNISVALEQRSGNDDSLNQVKEDWMKQEAYRSVVLTSLYAIKAEKLELNGENSVMGIMRTFVENRFGSEEGTEFLARAANVGKDQGIITDNDIDYSKDKQLKRMTEKERITAIMQDGRLTDSLVLKKLLALKSFQAYLQMKQYKQQLRQEGILATILSKELDL